MDTIDQDLPAHTVESVRQALAAAGSDHPPRSLVLYGSLREVSYSRKLARELREQGALSQGQGV